jgi:integrase
VKLLPKTRKRRRQRTVTVRKLFDGRLRIEQRPPRRAYYARACIQGKLIVKSTGEPSLPAAKRVATEWYQDLLAKDRLGESIHARTFGDVAEKFLKYQDEVQHVSAGQRGNYHDKWSVLKPYLAAVKINEIDLQFLEDLRERRYQKSVADKKPVSPGTLKKDLVFIRLVLRHAMDRERCLDHLPAFPSFGQQKWKIVPKPRPFFTKAQYDTLKQKASERIRTADNPRLREQRQELYDFILMCVGGCLRVDEARNLRFKNVEITRQSGEDVLRLQVLGKHSPDGRTTEDGFGMYGAVPAFRRLRKRRPDATPDDFLFVHHHRDGFRELLDACGMRETERGKRDLKSLRPTGISLRLDLGPANPDFRALAKIVRTSPEMIHKFYDQTRPAELLDRVMGFREPAKTEQGRKRKTKASSKTKASA